MGKSGFLYFMTVLKGPVKIENFSILQPSK